MSGLFLRDDALTDVTAAARHAAALPSSEWFSRATWQHCAAAGLTGRPLDAQWGGRGDTLLDTAAAFASFGRAGAPPGLVFALGAQLWSVTMVIARFGSDAQHHRWLAPLCTGEVTGAHAMTEPGSGSDAFSLATIARDDGEHVVLDGAKTFVTNGPSGDVFVVFATADRALGWAGISAFLVERDTPGMMVGPVLATMSPSSAPLAEVVLDQCKLRAADRLGRAGSGMSIFTYAMELERSMLAAGMVGITECRLRAVLGGRPAPVLADAAAGLWSRSQTTRLLIERAATRLDQGRKAPVESALAKLSASELWYDAAQLSTLDGGARSMLAGGADDLADAVSTRIYSGTSQIQRDVLGRKLGL
ncbi:MAG: hypothetical protein QOI95_3272 [Acidimicrobiaceae bacterium]